jgi:hypothetical protein
MAPLTDNASPKAPLFPVVPLRAFYEQHSAAALKASTKELVVLGRHLKKRLGKKRVLGVALYPWHDQTTLWWFEQGILSLMAAADWEVHWITDARYSFDNYLLDQMPGSITVHRGVEHCENPPAGNYDVALSLFPSDAATRLAMTLDLPLVAFAIKNLRAGLPPLQVKPPPGTSLWHGFAGSWNFKNAARSLFGETDWQLKGAPFPVNRYYLQPSRQEPDVDVMLFGSKSRDYYTALRAIRIAGFKKVAAIVDEEHKGELKEQARAQAVPIEISGPLSHLDISAFIQRSRVVVNPIVTPAESHYSQSLPLALGRPIVTSDVACNAPFVGDACKLAPLRHVERWAEEISKFIDLTKGSIPFAPALQQAKERHDVHRFFASALLETLGGGDTSGTHSG